MPQYSDESTAITWNYSLDGSNATIGIQGASWTSPGHATTSGVELSGAITIPSTVDGYSVTGIGPYAFYNCTSLTSIDFSGTQVTTIGGSGIRGCNILTSITLPVSLTSIGTQCFTDCSSLASIDFSGTQVEIIPLWSFQHCTDLSSVTFPDSLTTLGNSSFQNCTSLQAVTFSADSQLSSVGNDVFDPSGLTTFTAPSSVLIRLGLIVGPNQSVGDKSGVTVIENVTANAPPTITLIGSAIIYVLQDSTATYSDPGATAINDDGTDLSSSVEVSGEVVNLSTINKYVITYTIVDPDSGLSATASRQVYVVTEIPNATCFPAGTPVQTDQGVTSIDQLVPGEHTLRGKSIIAITQTSPLQKHIVCFEKDSIGKNVPSQQTHCSKEHKVLYQGEMVKARDLADMCKNVKKVSYNGETLYNVLLEKHGKMLVNNMICETLHPENIAAKFAKAKSSPSKRAVA